MPKTSKEYLAELGRKVVTNDTSVSYANNIAMIGGTDLYLPAGSGIVANGSVGTAGQVLSTNGSSVYWANVAQQQFALASNDGITISPSNPLNWTVGTSLVTQRIDTQKLSVDLSGASITLPNIPEGISCFTLSFFDYKSGNYPYFRLITKTAGEITTGYTGYSLIYGSTNGIVNSQQQAFTMQGYNIAYDAVWTFTREELTNRWVGEGQEGGDGYGGNFVGALTLPAGDPLTAIRFFCFGTPSYVFTQGKVVLEIIS